jgi:hypothetical protein
LEKSQIDEESLPDARQGIGFGCGESRKKRRIARPDLFPINKRAENPSPEITQIQQLSAIPASQRS